MKAVIIAAGCGSRLHEKHQGIPKTLLKLRDKRIIDDIIKKISLSGINDIIIVTGYKNSILENALGMYKKTDIKIQFVHNQEWKKANGISIFKAKDALNKGDEFVLLMSDHIFSGEMLKKTISTKIKKNEALLAIDFKIDQIPDLDDGMKIQCSRFDSDLYKISNFGKKLIEYKAIDTGIFKFNYNFFEILEHTINSGKTSLSDSCNTLSQNGNMLGLDIGEELWLDVDTPEMIEETDILDKIF